jgi:uroporphyrinogen III methyltransferase/synthase
MENRKPLQNKSVLVACSAKKMSTLSEGLRVAGARVLPFPVIEIRGIEDKRMLDAALESLDRYAWVIFTSVHTAAFFSRRFEQLKISPLKMQNVRICAIGPSTAKALLESGFETDLVPERYVAEGVIEALGKFHGGLENLSGYRILLPRAKEARDVLPKALTDTGARVDIVVCYETVRSEMSDAEIRAFAAERPDITVFTSSSTVRNAMALLGDVEGKRLLENSTVAAIGTITADTIESYGKHADIIPEESTIASLIRAIEAYFSRP